VLQVQPAHERVLVTEPPGAGHGQVGDLLAHHPAGQVGEHARVTLAGDERIDHVPCRAVVRLEATEAGLDAAVLEDPGQALQLAGPRLDQLLAVCGSAP
jgi:hypothetical protein